MTEVNTDAILARLDQTMVERDHYRDLVARMVKLSEDLHAEGRSATSRRSYTEGVVLRVIANAIRQRLELEPISYDGLHRTEEGQ